MRLPAHWLDLAGQLVLRRLVAQAAICRAAGGAAAAAAGAGPGRRRGRRCPGRPAWRHRPRSVAYLLGQLRATPRSRMVSRAAGPEVEQAPQIPPVGDQSVPRREQDANDAKVTGADIIAFIETVCFVPEGKFVGKKLAAAGVAEGPRSAASTTTRTVPGGRSLSMGRKNAKTTLAACLLLAHLCGPPARNKPNSQLFSAAQSRDQAAIIFSLAAKMVRMNPRIGTGGHHPGNRQGAALPRARHALPRAQRRRHDCVWAVAGADHP